MLETAMCPDVAKRSLWSSSDNWHYRSPIRW